MPYLSKSSDVNSWMNIEHYVGLLSEKKPLTIKMSLFSIPAHYYQFDAAFELIFRWNVARTHIGYMHVVAGEDHSFAIIKSTERECRMTKRILTSDGILNRLSELECRVADAKLVSTDEVVAGEPEVHLFARVAHFLPVELTHNLQGIFVRDQGLPLVPHAEVISRAFDHLVSSELDLGYADQEIKTLEDLLALPQTRWVEIKHGVDTVLNFNTEMEAFLSRLWFNAHVPLRLKCTFMCHPFKAYSATVRVGVEDVPTMELNLSCGDEFEVELAHPTPLVIGRYSAVMSVRGLEASDVVGMLVDIRATIDWVQAQCFRRQKPAAVLQALNFNQPHRPPVSMGSTAITSVLALPTEVCTIDGKKTVTINPFAASSSLFFYLVSHFTFMRGTLRYFVKTRAGATISVRPVATDPLIWFGSIESTDGSIIFDMPQISLTLTPCRGTGAGNGALYLEVTISPATPATIYVCAMPDCHFYGYEKSESGAPPVLSATKNSGTASPTQGVEYVKSVRTSSFSGSYVKSISGA